VPRVSEAEKQKSHDRILDAASRLLRESGAETASVAEIMEAAGMTHGGFYRHFGSKDEMVAAAFQHTVDGIVEAMEAASPGEDRDRERQSYIETYLSADHVDNRGKGCPLASLATELSRGGGMPRHAAAETVNRMAGLLDPGSPENTSQGLATMAQLLGTIVLARLSEDQETASSVLESGRTAVRMLQGAWPTSAS